MMAAPWPNGCALVRRSREETNVRGVGLFSRKAIPRQASECTRKGSHKCRFILTPPGNGFEPKMGDETLLECAHYFLKLAVNNGHSAYHDTGV